MLLAAAGHPEPDRLRLRRLMIGRSRIGIEGGRSRHDAEDAEGNSGKRLSANQHAIPPADQRQLGVPRINRSSRRPISKSWSMQYGADDRIRSTITFQFAYWLFQRTTAGSAGHSRAKAATAGRIEPCDKGPTRTGETAAGVFFSRFRCTTHARLGRRLKMLVGKPGLDGHSNGAEQIAVAARDSGIEVVYEGIRLTPARIANAALEEGVHIVGLSILSGSHMPLVKEVLRRMRERASARSRSWSAASSRPRTRRSCWRRAWRASTRPRTARS